jgi:CRISPR-associated endonuclease/helicase Cas3
MYFAHSLPDADKSKWQKLEDHLGGVSQLAESFAHEFGAEAATKAAGILHDLGKYSQKFQARLSGSKETVDHAAAGAKTIKEYGDSPFDKIMAELISYAIAGHHAGLADYADLKDRLKKNVEYTDEIWRQELAPFSDAFWPKSFRPSEQKKALFFQLAFLGRMIFSCLVDADFKDTETFYARHEGRIPDRDWPDLRKDVGELIDRFDHHMAGIQAKPGPLNLLRSQILAHVRAKSVEPKGLFTLTVPTGGGKTLASLGFALDHAKAHGLRRIIYSIPFTSIIDQNSAVFRDVLGDDYILEHHASIDDESLGSEQRAKLRLAMEDWAAPIIVTTNVQLFESLFANRPSRCRKLHNLADSVIVLDEVQTLPLNLLRPCLAAIDELARNYGASVILCTATQPAFDKRHLKNGLALEGRELAPDPAKLAKQLARVKLSKGHELDDSQLVEALRANEQAMIIVNSRQHALVLYKAAKEASLEGVIHLTTRQYANHRRRILDEVRTKLASSEPCRLIATSLVEAGVDIDFPRVWRAEAGLDQIAQAAGRCNRENKRPVEESIVTIFKAKDHKPPREIAQLANDFAAIADKYPDLLSPEAINAYFNEVFWRKGDEKLDAKEILTLFSVSEGHPMFGYKTAAEKFQMIESGLKPVIVNDNGKVEAVLDRLNSPDVSPGKAAQELQAFIVQIPRKDFDSLCRNGQVEYCRSDLWGEQFAVLTDIALYVPETGLRWEDADVLENTIF